MCTGVHTDANRLRANIDILGYFGMCTCADFALLTYVHGSEGTEG